MNSSVFMTTLHTLSVYAEIHANLETGGFATNELVEASTKLEVAMAKIIHKLLETEGQVA